MGELRSRGGSSSEEEQPTGRFGKLGRGIPHDHDHPHTPEDVIARVKKLYAIVDNIIDLYSQVVEDPNNRAKVEAYTEAINGIFDLSPAEVLTVLGAGIGAMYEIKKRGL